MPIQRITFSEREKIEMYLRMRKKKAWIEKRLRREYSVIKWEIARNSGKHLPYTAASAQTIADQNVKKTNRRKLEKEENAKLREYVEIDLLRDILPNRSPGSFWNILRMTSLRGFVWETIYQYVYVGEGLVGGFYKKLRRKQKRYDRKSQKSRIPSRISIHERPRHTSIFIDFSVNY
ncbi:MAG: hypothetical protein ACSLEX_00255 [Minisyncoccota bacterium]